MKLIIKRGQRDKKGLLGGHKGVSFALECRVELTDIEKDLVNRYKAMDYVLTYREDREGKKIPGLRVSNMLAGVQQEIDDVATLLGNEDVIKGACQEFKNLLSIMASFGGEEVIEF
ncbi:MAG: hypothetical protein V1797_11025 [Pseudomonadota bacterium]